MVWGSQGLNLEDLPEEEQFVTVRKRFSGMRMSGASGNAGEEGGDEAEISDSFGFGEGGFYSFYSFRRKAHDFRDKWFSGWNRCVRFPYNLTRTLRFCLVCLSSGRCIHMCMHMRREYFLTECPVKVGDSRGCREGVLAGGGWWRFDAAG